MIKKTLLVENVEQKLKPLQNLETLPTAIVTLPLTVKLADSALHDETLVDLKFCVDCRLATLSNNLAKEMLHLATLAFVVMEGLEYFVESIKERLLLFMLPFFKYASKWVWV